MDQQLQDFLDRLNQADNRPEAWNQVNKYFTDLGFDSLVYAFYGDADISGIPLEFYTTTPDGWMEYYLQENFVSDDPVFHHCSTSMNPLNITKLTDNVPLNAGQLRVVNAAADSGLKNGIAVPLGRLKSCEFGSMGIFTSLPDIAAKKLTSAYEKDLVIASLYSHMHIQSLIRKERQASVKITPRQRELLLWLAKGLQNDQVADKLGISYAGVSYLLGELKNRMGVRTRREILPKALSMGLIDP